MPQVVHGLRSLDKEDDAVCCGGWRRDTIFFGFEVDELLEDGLRSSVVPVSCEVIQVMRRVFARSSALNSLGLQERDTEPSDTDVLADDPTKDIFTRLRLLSGSGWLSRY